VPALGELSGAAPETAERNTLAFIRSVYPALTERDFYAGVRPLLQAVRQGSSHMSILTKMLIYVLAAAQAREGLPCNPPAARCPHGAASAVPTPSAPALLALAADGAPKLVAASGIPNDRAYTAFVAACALPLLPTEGPSRLDKLHIDGDVRVTAVWGAGDCDMNAVPWDSVATLARYTDAYVTSVGAFDDLDRAIGIAFAIPWRTINGPASAVAAWADDISVPADHRMTDSLPHTVRTPALPMSLDEKTSVVGSGTVICARLALMVPTAIVWCLQHAGVWAVGHDLAGRLARGATHYLAPDGTLATAVRRTVGAVYDLDLGYAPGCGPGGQLAPRLVNGGYVPLRVGEAGAAALPLTARPPPHAAYWLTKASLPRATSGAPVLVKDGNLRGAVACASACGVDITVDPQVCRSAGTHAFSDRLGPSEHRFTRIAPGDWWDVLDLPAATADGSCTLGWLTRPSSPREIPQWLAAGALAAGAVFEIAAFAYGGEDEEVPPALLDPGFGTDAWDAEYSWLTAAGAPATGLVVGPVADPTPPAEARADESGFGFAAETVDPAGVAAVRALHGAPGEAAAQPPAAGLAAAATALAVDTEPGGPPV